MNRKSTADWTSEHIQRFWDWHGSNPHAEMNYFSNQVGLGIVNFLEMTGWLKGKVLDYGCGIGHLLNYLLERGLDCYGVDSSERSIAKVNDKFSDKPNWIEGKVIERFVTSYPDNYFDVITCIETLEHLPDDLVSPMLVELERILKPGGILMITTPYSENLDEDMSYCPFCDSEYHKWQHMRSLSIEYMKTLMNSYDLQIVFCRNMDFMSFKFMSDVDLPPLTHISLRKLKQWIKFQHRCLLDKLFPKAFPNGMEIKYRLSLGRGSNLCTLATK